MPPLGPPENKKKLFFSRLQDKMRPPTQPTRSIVVSYTSHITSD